MRKGQIYSFIVILIIIPLVIFILVNIISLQQADKNTIDKIISDQIHQTESIITGDFNRAIKTGGRRSLLAMMNVLLQNETGQYVTDAKGHMVELMTNGSYDNEINIIMFNNTLPVWRDKILSVGINFDKTLNYSNLEVTNYDGFNILATLNYEVTVADRTNKSRVDKNGTKTILISAQGFEDPIVVLETGGLASKRVTKSPYPFQALKVYSGTTTGNCSGNLTFDDSVPDPSKILVNETTSAATVGWRGVISEDNGIPGVTCYMLDASNAVVMLSKLVNDTGYEKVYLDEITGVWMLPIEDVISSGYYSTFATSGPDFLDRLEGRLTETANGLESFVNVEEMKSIGFHQSPVDDDKTSIDYLYFDSAVHTGYPVRLLESTYSWFRLNCTQGMKYNLSELVQNNC